MRTAFDQAKAWGIVPKFVPTPGEKSEDREKGHEAIRQACKAMEKEYRARAALMRRPPSPGPKPPRCEGAPPFPAAQNYPADPKLNEYPETEEQFEQNRLILQKLSEQMEESMGAEKKILAEYTVCNDEWLDTQFYPHEPEKRLWEVANEVLEEWETDERARIDLRDQAMKRWAPFAAYIGIGLAAAASAAWLAGKMLGAW
jgi:hypothetical protein